LATEEEGWGEMLSLLVCPACKHVQLALPLLDSIVRLNGTNIILKAMVELQSQGSAVGTAIRQGLHGGRVRVCVPVGARGFFPLK
jgi:hypothetical protein